MKNVQCRYHTAIFPCHQFSVVKAFLFKVLYKIILLCSLFPRLLQLLILCDYFDTFVNGCADGKQFGIHVPLHCIYAIPIYYIYTYCILTIYKCLANTVYSTQVKTCPCKNKLQGKQMIGCGKRTHFHTNRALSLSRSLAKFRSVSLIPFLPLAYNTT